MFVFDFGENSTMERSRTIGNLENLKVVPCLPSLQGCYSGSVWEANSLFPVLFIKQDLVYSRSRNPDILLKWPCRKEVKSPGARYHVELSDPPSSISCDCRRFVIQETLFYFRHHAVSRCVYLCRKGKSVIWNCVESTGSRMTYFVPVSPFKRMILLRAPKARAKQIWEIWGINKPQNPPK